VRGGGPRLCAAEVHGWHALESCGLLWVVVDKSRRGISAVDSRFLQRLMLSHGTSYSQRKTLNGARAATMKQLATRPVKGSVSNVCACQRATTPTLRVLVSGARAGPRILSMFSLG
jgi:hypothetical protein